MKLSFTNSAHRCGHFTLLKSVSWGRTPARDLTALPSPGERRPETCRATPVNNSPGNSKRGHNFNPSSQFYISGTNTDVTCPSAGPSLGTGDGGSSPCRSLTFRLWKRVVLALAERVGPPGGRGVSWVDTRGLWPWAGWRRDFPSSGALLCPTCHLGSGPGILWREARCQTEWASRGRSAARRLGLRLLPWGHPPRSPAPHASGSG